MNKDTSKYWIEQLQLRAHPEGGYYKEVYRSTRVFKPSEIGQERNYATSIYFLIEAGNASHFHSIQQDELWYYHAGDPLSVFILSEDGALNEIKIGPRIDQGQTLQSLIPAGAIFGSKSSGEYSLVGCMVSPGFDFDDFKLYTQSELLERFPNQDEIIKELGWVQKDL